MGAILTAILSGLSAAWSVVLSVLKAVPWQAWVLLAVFVGGMWFASSGRSIANLACGCRDRGNREPRIPDWKVVSVEDGSHLTVSYGLRQRRTALVTLYGVSIPADVADAARDELKRLAGDSVDLQDVKPEPVKGEAEAIRPPPSVAYVFGAHGCCQLAMLRAGLALDETGKEDWVAAQKAAKKGKMGYWGLKK